MYIKRKIINLEGHCIWNESNFVSIVTDLELLIHHFAFLTSNAFYCPIARRRTAIALYFLQRRATSLNEIKRGTNFNLLHATITMINHLRTGHGFARVSVDFTIKFVARRRTPASHRRGKNQQDDVQGLELNLFEKRTTD